ncbi:GGDEF domain-containing protein [Psychrobacter sp. I-STPA10]|uniref:GGDEF domain-containing protein n=1 Tax=Psychrobacter sp. I-STPA10 TaxID=2585769 RepID=UPI001E3FF8C0|nr:GGDEF domain-containing protein [Psychrobacter sp. I-STPA10]
MISRFYDYLRDNLVPVFLYWKAADKAVLLGSFILIETLMHWCWLLFIWLNSAHVSPFVDIDLIPSVFIGCSVFILIFSVLTAQFLKIKNSASQLFRYQLFLFIIYSLYISIVMKLVGQDSFVSGVALIGGTILAMMLIDRRIVLWGFLIQCILSIIYVITPYCSIELPSLKRTILFTILYQQPEALELRWWYAELASARLPELMSRQGQLFWHLCYIYFAFPKAIVIIYVMKKLLDVFDQNKASFQYQAEHDELTDLKNRRSIYHIMRQQICDQDNYDDMSIILIDLDYFKKINDVYGHLVGDEVLKWVGIQLNKQLPNGCSTGRYGGEEFLVLLPNSSQAQAIRIAKNLQLQFAQSAIAIEDSVTLNITASFGVATLDLALLNEIRQNFNTQKRHTLNITMISSEVDDTLKRLISQADQALYQAKSLGRNQVQSEPVLMK